MYSLFICRARLMHSSDKCNIEEDPTMMPFRPFLSFGIGWAAPFFFVICLRIGWVANLTSSCCQAQESTTVTQESDQSNRSSSPSSSATESRPAATALLETLVSRVRASLVAIRVDDRDGRQVGIGTGFFVDARGLIATNFHVIGEGRSIQVEWGKGRVLKVEGIEAFDRKADLALVRVAQDSAPFPALPLNLRNDLQQGSEVLAFGNPLGLEYSVVRGIVSALREVEGQSLIQLAMPIEPGNSGGPVVDLDGHVHGIVNMKSAVDDNLGFAIPIDQLQKLIDRPNPITWDRWLRWGSLDAQRWETRFGATWTEQSGRLVARGTGNGFGGRALCLSTLWPPEPPYDVVVRVRLDDERGAAGLVFQSDGQERHFGFYPSGGRLRLTDFQGPSIYSWQILSDAASPHYRPGQWNHLRVHVERERFLCYVNGQEVASGALTPSEGRQQVGLAKFRDTVAQFQGFQVGKDLAEKPLDSRQLEAIERWRRVDGEPIRMEGDDWNALAEGTAAVDVILSKAASLEERAKQMRQAAAAIESLPAFRRWEMMVRRLDQPESLMEAALALGAIDDPAVEVDRYVRQVEKMAEEILARFPEGSSEKQKMDLLLKYLFEENGFHGSRQEYYHTANNQMHRVIEDREGMPIALSVLVIDLARRCGMGVDGVGMPGHFLVRLTSDNRLEGPWIDPFESGEWIDEEQLQKRFVETTGQGFLPEDLPTFSNRQILQRMLRNLIGSAERKGDSQTALRYLDAMVALSSDDVATRLQRAVLRGQNGRYPEALEDLQWVIDQQPESIDIHELLRLRQSIQERAGG
jgi:regulator of sirC expression with transglutaminase-like and TPR domain